MVDLFVFSDLLVQNPELCDYWDLLSIFTYLTCYSIVHNFMGNHSLCPYINKYQKGDRARHTKRAYRLWGWDSGDLQGNFPRTILGLSPSRGKTSPAPHLGPLADRMTAPSCGTAAPIFSFILVWCSKGASLRPQWTKICHPNTKICLIFQGI